MKTNTKIPEIYILGAPKCGTTSLYSLLVKRDDVYASSIKEPAFFAKDMPKARITNTEQAYESLYENAGKLKTVDASTVYFYSNLAVTEILKYKPDAKFMIILRSPVEMVVSLYHQQRLSLHEPEKTFERAWDDSDRRMLGAWKSIHNYPHAVSYKEAGLLGKYVAQIAKIVPNENLHIIFLEDLKSNFRKTYIEILEFLGLPDDGCDSIGVKNAASERRFRFLFWFFISSSGPLGPIKHVIKRVFKLQNTWLITKIYKITTKPLIKKRPISSKTLADVQSEFSDDLNKLENLLNRSLMHWRKHDLSE